MVQIEDIQNKYNYLINKYPDLKGWIFNFLLVYSKKRSAILLEMLNVELKNIPHFKDDLLAIVEQTKWLKFAVEDHKYKRYLIYNDGQNILYPHTKNEDLVTKVLNEKGGSNIRNICLGRLLNFYCPNDNCSDDDKKIITYCVDGCPFMTQVCRTYCCNYNEKKSLKVIKSQLESYKKLSWQLKLIDSRINLNLTLEVEEIPAKNKIKGWFASADTEQLWENKGVIFNEIAQLCVIGRESELITYKVMHSDYFTFIRNILPIRIMYNLSLETPWAFFWPPTEENEEMLFDLYKKVEANIYDCLVNNRD